MRSEPHFVSVCETPGPSPPPPPQPQSDWPCDISPRNRRRPHCHAESGRVPSSRPRSPPCVVPAGSGLAHSEPSSSSARHLRGTGAPGALCPGLCRGLRSLRNSVRLARVRGQSCFGRNDCKLSWDVGGLLETDLGRTLAEVGAV